MAMKCLLKCHLSPFPFTLPAAASVGASFFRQEGSAKIVIPVNGSPWGDAWILYGLVWRRASCHSKVA